MTNIKKNKNTVKYYFIIEAANTYTQVKEDR